MFGRGWSALNRVGRNLFAGSLNNRVCVASICLAGVYDFFYVFFLRARELFEMHTLTFIGGSNLLIMVRL